MRAERAKTKAERTAAAKKADDITRERRAAEAEQRAERRSAADTVERDRINAEKEQRRKEQKEAREQRDARQEKAKQEKREQREAEKKAPPTGSYEKFLGSMKEAACVGAAAPGCAQAASGHDIASRDTP